MSIPVDLDKLEEAMADYQFAYLLTVGDDERARSVAVLPELVDGALVLPNVGQRSQANCAARPEVALVWPPATIAEYSLIVDGPARVGESDTVIVTPTRAVLHRSGTVSAAANAAEGECVADCIELS